MKPAIEEYAAPVAEYFARPPQPLAGHYRACAGSVSAGALVEVRADMEEGRLSRPVFRAFGCPHIIAACNLLAERLDGEPVEMLVDPALPDMWQVLEVPVEKAGKMLILQDALLSLHEACDADKVGTTAVPAPKD